MKDYSVDLRDRVLGSGQNGRAQTWIVCELGISLGSVKRYTKLYQVTRLAREKPIIGDAELVEFKAQVDSHQDAASD